jgi:hypothetical protein
VRPSLPTPSSHSEHEFQPIPQESILFSTSEKIECANRSELTSRQDPESHQTHEEEEENISPTIEVATKEDSLARQTLEFETSEKRVPKGMLIIRETPAPEQESPLRYGDLVVVEYAEKKKIYKWPAIVFTLFPK